MTGSQARRIEMLLAAQVAVATETMVLVSLGAILGGRGVQKQETADILMSKAKETKELINSVLRAATEDREHESKESAAELEAAEAALQAQLKGSPVGFRP